MLKILINAYACSPNMGSEPGMAWNWCMHLAKYCEVHIITEGEFRDKIESVVPQLPQGKNMHFYYNPVPDEVRKMCWNQGDWRFYKYYRQWQYKTYEIALEIMKTKHIDILHQLNMIGFREPGYLWMIPNVPFVWGPVDAKEKFPVAYLEGLTLKQKLFIRLKNFLTGLQLRYGRRIHKAASRASVIAAASSEARESFRKYFSVDAPLLNETGCTPLNIDLCKSIHEGPLHLLWVGKLDVRKQLTLAIRTLGVLRTLYNIDVVLDIVGGGSQEAYKDIAEECGVTDLCHWHGAVSHDEVQHFMQSSDLFFFTSVAEGTPHVVLEAIANKLPVLCHDCCGHGDSVNETIGYKVPLATPKGSIAAFAEKIKYLNENRDKLIEMSEACVKRQEELSWDNKAKMMVEMYEKVVLK